MQINALHSQSVVRSETEHTNTHKTCWNNHNLLVASLKQHEVLLMGLKNSPLIHLHHRNEFFVLFISIYSLFNDITCVCDSNKYVTFWRKLEEGN